MSCVFMVTGMLAMVSVLDDGRKGGQWSMSELSDAFVEKAAESLAGAVSEFGNGRYNNCANRTYYAAFQAAIAALDLAGVPAAQGPSGWNHGFVQAQFAGVLIGCRPSFRRNWSMKTDELIPLVAPDESDPRLQAALAELRTLIAARYPDACFSTYRGEDPDGIYLKAIVDVEDLDDVTDLFMDRLVELQVEGGLPVYVALDWPLERVRDHLRQKRTQSILARIPPVDWL